MLIPKPTNPEELYKFFIYGLPLNPVKRSYTYSNEIWRKGWNILNTSFRGRSRMWLHYYPTIGNKPLWKLAEYQYVNYVKQN